MFSKTILVLFFVSVALAAGPPPLSWSLCNATFQYPFTTTNVTMLPDPAQKGKNVVVTFQGMVNKPISGSGGLWWCAVYLGPVKVDNETGSLCEAMSNCPGCSCPVGPTSGQITMSVPGFAPSGKYTGTFESVDGSGNLMSCLNIVFYTVSGEVEARAQHGPMKLP